MQKPKKLLCLESIRGLAALMVVVTHLIYVFCPALNGDAADLENRGRVVRLIALSPLSVFHSGGLAVQIFFVLSGIVLSLSYLRKGDAGILCSAAIRRYFRLMIPALGSLLFVWLVMGAHGYHIVQAQAYMTQSSALEYPTHLGFLEALKLGTYGIFFNPGVSFDANIPLWTIAIELEGSFIIFAFLALFGRQTVRPAIYLLCGALCLASRQLFLLDFLLGIAICDAYVAMEKGRVRMISLPPWLGASLLAFGLFLGGLRKDWVSGLLRVRHEMAFSVTRASQVAVHKPGHLAVLSALLIVISIMFCPALSRAFEGRTLQFLGRISFPLYVLHVAVIYSLGCFLFIWMRVHGWTYAESALTASVVSLLGSIAIAWVGYYALDRVSVKAGYAFEGWMRKIAVTGLLITPLDYRDRLVGEERNLCDDSLTVKS